MSPDITLENIRAYREYHDKLYWSPPDFHRDLDKHITGQDEAKRIASTVLYNHLEGRPSVTLFHGRFQITGYDLPTPYSLHAAPDCVVFHLTLSVSLPKGLVIHKKNPNHLISLTAEKDTAHLTVSLRHDTLHLYFSDYKNYYYLPEEDMAVHKSVGVFVDPSHRKQATRQTCYQKAAGTFLPQPEEIFSPAFRDEPGDTCSWFRLEDLPSDPGDPALFSYLCVLLNNLN